MRNQLLRSVRKKYNWVRKGGIFTSDYDYRRHYDLANKFTEQMGFALIDLTFKKEYYSTEWIKDLANRIITDIYDKSGYTIYDMAQNCSIISIALQDWLKTQYQIESVVTSGTVYFDNFHYYWESKKVIKSRVKNPKFAKPVGFHT